ncbi:hypothetical protein, partial [Chitiniphilus shinanonensis]|uniref:hypothetical protein n=1 Tax=Chitiniphilus shinanonensis TaxID=553088 RepID=UPI0024E14196
RIGCNLLKISPPDTALLKPAKLFVSLRSALRLLRRNRTIRTPPHTVNSPLQQNCHPHLNLLIGKHTLRWHRTQNPTATQNRPP